MKKILITFLTIVSASAFAQSSQTLRDGESMNIRCAGSSIIKQTSTNMKSIQVSCVKACTVTLLKASSLRSGASGYCTRITVPRASWPTFDDCGSPVRTQQEAIERGLNSANRSVYAGECDDIVSIGF